MKTQGVKIEFHRSIAYAFALSSAMAEAVYTRKMKLYYESSIA